MGLTPLLVLIQHVHLYLSKFLNLFGLQLSHLQ